MRSLETRFAFERSHLACSCKWALAEVGCSDTSYPASVQPRQKASPCLSYCWWSFLVPATLLCMSCGSHPQPWLPSPALAPSGVGREADCGRDSPPFLHSQWCSCVFPAQLCLQRQLRGRSFYLFFQGEKTNKQKCSKPILYLFPFSSRP